LMSLHEGLLLGVPLLGKERGVHYAWSAQVCEERVGGLTHMLLLLLLLLLEHVRLLGLEMGEGMGIGTNARLHAPHHGTSLANGSVWARYSWMHLHALLHGVTGARTAHHMTLGHLHAGLWWEMRRLHHLARGGCGWPRIVCSDRLRVVLCR
jgi:hypothetical protein